MLKNHLKMLLALIQKWFNIYISDKNMTLLKHNKILIITVFILQKNSLFDTIQWRI